MVWEDGRVNACEILNDEIGNLNQDEIPDNFFQSKKSTKLRNKIKDTKCKMLLQCSGVWIINGKFGCSWKAVQMRIEQPKNLIEDYAFDDSDDDNDDKNIISSSEEEEDC